MYDLELYNLFALPGVASTVKKTLHEACIQLLSPKRRIDILRDAMDAKTNRRPYTIVFCGVNGVGKSTNLAKVCGLLALISSDKKYLLSDHVTDSELLLLLSIVNNLTAIIPVNLSNFLNFNFFNRLLL